MGPIKRRQDHDVEINRAPGAAFAMLTQSLREQSLYARNGSATLTALQTRIDAYREAIGSPRVARAQKTTATTMLETEFARAGMIVQDRIDGLIEQFKSSGTNFYSDYKSARRIVNTGS